MPPQGEPRTTTTTCLSNALDDKVWPVFIYEQPPAVEILHSLSTGALVSVGMQCWFKVVPTVIRGSFSHQHSCIPDHTVANVLCPWPPSRQRLYS